MPQLYPYHIPTLLPHDQLPIQKFIGILPIYIIDINIFLKKSFINRATNVTGELDLEGYLLSLNTAKQATAESP